MSTFNTADYSAKEVFDLIHGKCVSWGKIQKDIRFYCQGKEFHAVFHDDRKLVVISGRDVVGEGCNALEALANTNSQELTDLAADITEALKILQEEGYWDERGGRFLVQYGWATPTRIEMSPAAEEFSGKLVSRLYPEED